MKRTLIQHAVIVNEGRKVLGSVVIENEKIAEILVGEEKATAPCDEVIDASGCYLLPGVIDEHVHFRDPGLTHKADITTESHAAAAGGVTSIMDMPNTNPQTTTLEALEEKFTLLGEKSAVNYSCYFGATNTNYTQFAQLDKHRVCGVKLFMGSSTGNMLVDRMASLRNIFGGTDLLIAAHCEDQGIIKENTDKYKKEYEKLNKVLCGVRTMEKLPNALIIVDPKKEINAIREARKLNIPVFGLVDTNCDPDDVDFVIPGNDDAVRSVKVVLGVLTNAICEAKGLEVVDYVTEEEKPKKEFKAKETKKEEVVEKAENVEVVEEETEVIVSDGLSDKTVADLRAMAKEAGVKGYSTMKKDELISNLK